MDVDDFHIQGATFQVWNGGGVSNDDKSVTFNKGKFVYMLAGAGLTVHDATSPSMKLEVFGGGIFRITSEMRGDGLVQAQTYKGHSQAVGFYDFQGINTNFTGRILVTSPSGSTGPNETNYVTLIVRDGRNLGGARKSLVPDALKVEQQSMLRVVGDVTIDQTNLGVGVAGLARFYVEEDKSLTIKNTLTVSGELRKEGLGTLALGGDVRFGDGSSEDTPPSAGHNILNIKEGTLKVLSKTACDGLTVVFAEGTRLVVPYDSDAGLCDVKWDTPLTINTADGTLPVEIDLKGTTPTGGFDVAVATVNATAAALLEPSVFAVQKPYKDFNVVQVTKRVNDDGTVVFVASVSPTGFTLLVR